MVSQNAPFIPIHDAWKADSRAMLPLDDELARKQVEEIESFSTVPHNSDQVYRHMPRHNKCDRYAKNEH